MTGRPQERRKGQRHWTHRNAQITLGAHTGPLPCVILDLSDSGARLEVSSPSANLPRHFTLVLFKDGSLQRDCEIAWSDRRYAGVRFVSEWYGAVLGKLALAIEEGPMDTTPRAGVMAKIDALLAKSRQLMRDGDFKRAESAARKAIHLRQELAGVEKDTA